MFYFAIDFIKYLKHINAKSPFSCTDFKNCARKRAFIGYVLPFCISAYTLYGIRTLRSVSLLLFFRLLTRLFAGILSYVQVRIRNTGMVNSLESFDEYLFSESDVSERATCPSMSLLTRLLMLSSVYSFREREAASTVSAIIRMACSRVNGFGPGYWNCDLSITSVG